MYYHINIAVYYQNRVTAVDILDYNKNKEVPPIQWSKENLTSNKEKIKNMLVN